MADFGSHLAQINRKDTTKPILGGAKEAPAPTPTDSTKN